LTLLLKENDVINLLDYKQIYESLLNAFLLFDNKLAINLERSRISFHGTTLTFQAAAMENYMGYKTFISSSHLTFLYDTAGNFLSIIESDRLSQVRTCCIVNTCNRLYIWRLLLTRSNWFGKVWSSNCRDCKSTKERN